ncbi:protein stum homolog isoform X1 [Podarcis muralis]
MCQGAALEGRRGGCLPHSASGERSLGAGTRLRALAATFIDEQRPINSLQPAALGYLGDVKVGRGCEIANKLFERRAEGDARTFVSAFTVLCGARTDLPDRHICCVFWLNIAAALIQILTAIVMVGWIMSIFWGMDMVILATERRCRAAESDLH